MNAAWSSLCGCYSNDQMDCIQQPEENGTLNLAFPGKLAAYVGQTGFSCDPDGTTDTLMDLVCQLGGSCVGSANCGKVRRFDEMRNSSCPDADQCDAGGVTDTGGFVSTTIEIRVIRGYLTPEPFYDFTNEDGGAIDLTSYEFVRGNTYVFKDGSTDGSLRTHPFMIAPGRAATDGTISGYDALYGTTVPPAGLGSKGDALVEELRITIPEDYTGSLVYFCTIHPSMTSKQLTVVNWLPTWSTGCLSWIESLSPEELSSIEGNAWACGEDDRFADRQTGIYATELAQIWYKCAGGRESLVDKELLECKLRGGKNCAGFLGSTEFQLGFVWTDVGYEITQQVYWAFPGAKPKAQFTKAHFDDLNWQAMPGDPNFKTIGELAYSLEWISKMADDAKFVEGYAWAEAGLDYVESTLEGTGRTVDVEYPGAAVGAAFAKAHFEKFDGRSIYELFVKDRFIDPESPSVEFEVGSVWTEDGFKYVEPALQYYPGAAVDAEFTKAHFDALNYDRTPGSSTFLTMSSLMQVQRWIRKPPICRSDSDDTTLASLISRNGGVCSNVVISKGSVITIDANTRVVGFIEVAGVLRCDNSVAGFVLQVGNIIVDGDGDNADTSGLFDCDVSNTAAAKHEFRIELIGNENMSDSTCFTTRPEYKSIIVRNKGTLRLTGHSGKAWAQPMHRLAATAKRGASKILLRPTELPLQWRAGDEIVIATTSFYRQYAGETTFAQLRDKYSTAIPDQNERRKIVAVEWKSATDQVRIVIDRPLDYNHYGRPPQVYREHVLDEAAHVVNLNRNLKVYGSVAPGDLVDTRADVGIVLRSNGIGGHIMIEPDGQAHIDSIEMYVVNKNVFRCKDRR